MNHEKYNEFIEKKNKVSEELNKISERAIKEHSKIVDDGARMNTPIIGLMTEEEKRTFWELSNQLPLQKEEMYWASERVKERIKNRKGKLKR